ncbi:MAG: Integrase core protein [Actinoallomurus sp.]|nr:Integrase core protein [Actinoallomurus sp.]
MPYPSWRGRPKALGRFRQIYLIFIRLLGAIALLLRSDVSKDAEILVLRHQLSVHGRPMTSHEPPSDTARALARISMAEVPPTKDFCRSHHPGRRSDPR